MLGAVLVRRWADRRDAATAICVPAAGAVANFAYGRCLVPLCAVVVWGYAGARLETAFFGVFDFPEIAASTWSWTAFKLGWTTCLALLALAAVGSAAWLSARTGTAATAVFTAIGIWGVAVMTAITSRSTNPWSQHLHSATDLKPARAHVA
ncbi:hypothetical protein [Nonomuraea sp. SYSU D8015]|uniref:hypothetical protein n=1 Tax=Nonomuraea sp. SYSU D8015 TaxID=2593644 RepID=UPI001660C9F0|nr:hypothetical protein [Nonomuraea sp. SYSU D8015]